MSLPLFLSQSCYIVEQCCGSASFHAAWKYHCVRILLQRFYIIMYVNWKNIISYHFENNVHGKINLKGVGAYRTSSCRMSLPPWSSTILLLQICPKKFRINEMRIKSFILMNSLFSFSFHLKYGAFGSKSVLFFKLWTFALQKLESSSSELEQFERDIFSLRQELSARGGAGGGRLTASLETELRHVQEQAGQLQRSRGELVRNIHYLRGNNILT
jgi:hypothetical protein